jgi:tripartite-type tricarboxylate transporter receptor subunit TctC
LPIGRCPPRAVAYEGEPAIGDEMPGSAITIRTMAPQGATQDQLLVHLKELLGRRFATELAIVNSPGRDGIEAAKSALGDPADGRHFLLTSAYALNYYPRYGEGGYRSEDFEPVAGIGGYNFVHVTAAANPWRDLHEALAAMRAEGRPLRFAGVGEVDLLMMKAMAKRAGVAVEFKQTGGPALLAAVLAREADVGVGTGTHEKLLREGAVRVLAELHPRARGGPGRPPTPKDFGADLVQDNFALLSTRRGAAPAAKAKSVEILLAALDEPSVTALIADRLLMVPGLLRGAALAAALAAQREAFVKLRAYVAA